MPAQFLGAGGEVEDGVSVVSGKQQDGYLFKPILHPGVWQSPLPCCQYAPPRAVGDILHSLEPTYSATGRTHMFVMICCD